MNKLQKGLLAGAMIFSSLFLAHDSNNGTAQKSMPISDLFKIAGASIVVGGATSLFSRNKSDIIPEPTVENPRRENRLKQKSRETKLG